MYPAPPLRTTKSRTALRSQTAWRLTNLKHLPRTPPIANNKPVPRPSPHWVPTDRIGRKFWLDSKRQNGGRATGRGGQAWKRSDGVQNHGRLPDLCPLHNCQRGSRRKNSGRQSGRPAIRAAPVVRQFRTGWNFRGRMMMTMTMRCGYLRNRRRHPTHRSRAASKPCAQQRYPDGLKKYPGHKLRSGNLDAQLFGQPFSYLLRQTVVHFARSLLRRIQHSHRRGRSHRHHQPDQR